MPVSAAFVALALGYPTATAVDFEREVLPILAQRCFECHGAAPKLKGGLRLTSRAGLLEGGDGGKAIDLEQAAKSRLLRALAYDDENLRMPPDGKLGDAEIATLSRWIESGAEWAGKDDYGVAPETTASEPAKKHDPWKGWSYRPIVRPSVPEATNPGYRAFVANPIDAFVLAKQEALGIRPAPPAPKRALIRRATFDLTGLPPSPEDVEAFVADASPDAFEKVVDRLLASPHYGEHWGRHWLDVVRYADTNGFERDGDKPFVWKYRDYVVRALNADVPFDRFAREQLAGDELDAVTPESLTATGYYRLMQWDDEPPEGALQARYDVLDDLVKTTSEAFLGVSIGCARCHDHKVDPIPQTDYYRFLALFHGVTDFDKEGRLADVAPSRTTGSEPDLAPVVSESGTAVEDVHVLARGNAAVKGERVAPGVPKILSWLPLELRAPPQGAKSSHRRRALAEWIVDPGNPLTARVLANRLWQFHFGRGIVASANDFGELGTRPSHPELLDWLASEVVARGWSLKAMHRLILSSSAYRMGTVGDPRSAEVDPGNATWWRFEGRRLSAEELRDAMLAVNGRLNQRQGGPPMFVTLPDAVLATASKPNEVWGVSPEDERCRRSLYIKVKRSLLPPMLTVFDFADVDASCPVRFTTTQPTQALALLNSPEVHEQSRHCARRLLSEVEEGRAGDDEIAAIERLWRLAFARPPSETEASEARDLLREQRGSYGRAGEAAMERLCLFVFNSNEFIYVD